MSRSNKRRILQLYAVAAALCVFFSAGFRVAEALDVNLADIVGGGNGTGTGIHGHGIDPLTGGTTAPAQFFNTQPNNTNSYHASTVAFVDGVFLPDGGAGAVTLDSAGHSYSSFTNTDGSTWDIIKYGPNQNSGTSLSSVNYDGGSHSMIGLHASKGITFDLLQIQAASPGMHLVNFTAVAGLSSSTSQFGAADWWVFVDGVLKQSQASSPGGVGNSINVALTQTNHFLTLVSTDAGNANDLDQIIFGDPLLHLAVPEPAGFVLAIFALTGLIVLRWRRCRSGE